MRKLLASIHKESLLFLHDKVGLLLMYLMPTLLVFIITIVQNSAFKLVNENRLNVLVVNKDAGALGDSLISLLSRTGNFSIERSDSLNPEQLMIQTINQKKLLGILIDTNFTEHLLTEAGHLSNLMLREFGATEDKIETTDPFSAPQLTIYYDPVLQENFRMTINNGIQTALDGLENSNMVRQLFKDMGYDSIPANIQQAMKGRGADIRSLPASLDRDASYPNSTQHNVPAWSLFAMFFMVISLGGNLVKERLSGSFIRLQTIPSAFLLVIVSKVILYLFVALTQLMLLFGIGRFVFPHIGLPSLNLPENFWYLIVITLLSASAAISFALLVGTYAKTQEQCNGFGAISVIIFAAIGGIWVPTFVMPTYLQNIALLSPLHWCLEGYYGLFLKQAVWADLSGVVIYLILFSFICQLLVFLRLRILNYI